MTTAQLRRRARGAVKELASGAIRGTGLAMLARRTWTRRGFGIVVYHDPSPERLDAHLRYLSARYSLVDVGEVETAIATRDWSQLASNALLVTFDDGHAGNAALVPVLERYGVRPLIYLCPDLIEGSGRFWFMTPGLDPEPLKHMTTAQRTAVVTASEDTASGRDALEPDEVRAMIKVADIGSHTLTHPILPLCTDLEAEIEIRESKSRVAALTGRPCLHFSYPNGDYSARDVQLVRDAGYATARTAKAGWNEPDCDPLLLKIAVLADHSTVNNLAAHLAGLFAVTRRWRERSQRRGRRAGPGYDVAFYVPWIAPLLTSTATTPTGGAETQIYLLARALAGRGARVKLLAFDLPDAPPPASIDQVDVAIRPPYRAHDRFGKVREVVAIARAVAGSDARVIVTRAAGPHVGVAGLCAKLLRRRFVHSSANVSDFDFARLESKRRNRALFRLGVRLADEIVVQSNEQVAMCQERFGRTPVRIGSIAEPADERRLPPEAFLWVGRLVWYKRPLEYVQLARSMPQARFWMIGVTVRLSAEALEVAAEVRRQAQDVPNLEILEPRPRTAVMELVDRAVAMVNTADFEGMPNVFLEAWARGVPALALTHDPDGVIHRHGLGEFAEGSTARLAALAARLWESRDDNADLAARCRAYIQGHHSADAVTGQWFDALGFAPSPSVASARNRRVDQ